MLAQKLRILIVAALVLTTQSAWSQFKLYEKGHDLYKEGKYAEAIKSLKEFLGRSTHDKSMDVEVHYLLALSHYKTNNFNAAVDDFQESLLLNHPNKGNIYWFMAKSYEAQNLHKEAGEQYTHALRELGADNQTKAKLLYERSQVYEKQGQLVLAYEDLKAGSIAHPANADVKRELDKLEKQGVASRSTTEIPQTTQTKQSESKTPAASDKKVTDKNASTPSNGGVAQQKTTEPKVDPKKDPVVTQTEESGTNDDLIANRLKSAGKTNSGTTKPATTPSTAQTQTQQTKQPEVQTKQTSRREQEKQAQQAVVKEEGNAKKNVRETVNSIASAYADERRFALVIGNSKYPKSIGVLRNPVNDATDVASELKKSNFEVQLVTDATYGQMRAAMLEFKEKVDAGDKDKTVALFYYAGHGLAHDDENYLVPIDASIEYEDDIARYCFGVQRMVLANMERSNSRMNIVILDACRNNPFPALTRSLGQQGLGEMKRARGSFIAYATAPGSVASDGTGKNGLYTQELVKAMRKPGLTIEQVFKEVRGNVGRLSGDKQNTWDSSNIIGEFYFKFPTN